MFIGMSGRDFRGVIVKPNLLNAHELRRRGRENQTGIAVMRSMKELAQHRWVEESSRIAGEPSALIWSILSRK